MSDESGTSFVKRGAEAFGEAIGKGIVKAVVGVLLATGLLGGSAFMNHRDARRVSHDTLWLEGGSHFQDLLQTNNIQEKEIAELRSRLWRLENPLAAKLNNPNFTDKDLNKILDEAESEIRRLNQ